MENPNNILNQKAGTGCFLSFLIMPLVPLKKTVTWEVTSKMCGDTLGYIRWKNEWRKYTLQMDPTPNRTIIFDKRCLEEVCTFLDLVNTTHKKFVLEEINARLS